MTTENKTLTKVQAEQLASALLAAEPRFKDSKLAKAEQVLERILDVNGPPRHPLFGALPFEPNPFTDPASPRYFWYNK